MKITVYPDVVFLVNFFMDFFLLWLLRIVLKLKGSRIRLAAGSAAGAFLSVLAFLAWLFWSPGGILGMLLWGCAAAGTGGVMVAVSYSLDGIREYFRAAAGLFFGAAITEGVLEWGGMLLFFTKGEFFQTGVFGLAGTLFFLAGGCLAAHMLWKGIQEASRERSCRYQVTLYCRNKKATAEGFLDTGNRLRDPISGRPVHVADRKLLEELNPGTEKCLIIPYRTIDGGGSVLKAVSLDRMEAVQGKRRMVYQRPLVAASPKELRMKNGCRILLHE